MQVNYGLGEKTKGPWMSEYVNFVHGIDRVLIVRETWFGYDCLKIIPQSWFVERDTKTVRDYVYSHYPFIQAEHKGKFETYLRDEINNHIGKLVVLHFTIPDTSAPKHGTGSGTSSDLQTLENKSQNINSMTNIDRIVLLLALTFHKMGKNIFDSFSMSDLYMIAGMFVIWAGSQFFGVGEVIDAALLAWLWWTIGWDCWRFLVIIINSVKTAIQATSIQQIDDAASQLAPAAAALGIDALMGFILHKFGKGSAVEEAAKKEIKTEEDLVKHDFNQKVEITPREIVKGSFTPQGMSEAEAKEFMNKNIVGQNMVKEFAEGHPDWSVMDVRDKVMETLKSGSNLPTEHVLKADDFLYKLQPSEYSSVLPSTPYLITSEHYEQALQLAKQQGTTLDKVLGLPESSVRGDYSIWKMTANKPATVFTNTIAPTQETVLQNGIEQVIQKPGGAVQDLLLNHNSFKQELMGTISNSPK